jgi:hypothetical protein
VTVVLLPLKNEVNSGQGVEFSHNAVRSFIQSVQGTRRRRWFRFSGIFPGSNIS